MDTIVRFGVIEPFHSTSYKLYTGLEVEGLYYRSRSNAFGCREKNMTEAIRDLKQ